MLQQNQEIKSSTEMPPQQQFGGNELLGIHEMLGGVIGALEHSALFEEHVQDVELTNIIKRQSVALTQMYNTIVSTLQTGQVPAVKTGDYEMQVNNTALYGMKPTTPKKPITSMSEINDACISSGLLGHLKGIATHLTSSSIEATNPILRRVMADSIPNVIEMAYEMFLYQNKHSYYQVPLLPVSEMQIIKNGFATIMQPMQH